jgi:hypothetical protein
MSEVRTERSHGLQDRLNATERSHLMSIRHTEGYEVLLDIMERACIAQETNIINCAPEDREKIYSEFLLSKAFWQVFVSMQKMVEFEVMVHKGIEAEEAAKRLAMYEDPEQAILRPEENYPGLGEV